MLDNCVFCDIVNGKTESDMIVYKNKYVTCFLDKNPINEGHILIVTNEHYLDLDDMPDNLARYVITTAKKILSALKKVYNLNGYTIMQNGGSFKNIQHFHMHIFPRYYDDEFGWVFSDEYKTVSEKTAEIISNALKEI